MRWRRNRHRGPAPGWDLGQPAADSILSVLDPQKYLILPNTSGARNADEAVRLAKMARAMGLPPWVNLKKPRTQSICCRTRWRR